MKTGDNVLISPEVTHKSDWTQGTVIEVEANPYHFNAVNALKTIDWFRKSVRDIRGYRVEEWSDFTDMVKKG